MADEIRAIAAQVAQLCRNPAVLSRFRSSIEEWSRTRWNNWQECERRRDERENYARREHWHYNAANRDRYANCEASGGFQLMRLSARVTVPDEFLEVAQYLFPTPSPTLTAQQGLLAGALKRFADGWSIEQVRDEYLACKCVDDLTATVNFVLPELNRLGGQARRFLEWKRRLPDEHPELFVEQHQSGHPFTGSELRVDADFGCVFPPWLSTSLDPEDEPLLPLPERALTLVEKYVVLAAVHDAWLKGKESISPWPPWPPKPDDPRELLFFREWFEHTKEDVRKLQDAEELNIFLQDVSDDLSPRKPAWERSIGKLFFNGNLAKQVKRVSQAKFVRILDAFEESGWPQQMDNPLDPRINLHEILRSLNDNMDLLSFHAIGEGICWQEKSANSQSSPG